MCKKRVMVSVGSAYSALGSRGLVEVAPAAYVFSRPSWRGRKDGILAVVVTVLL